MSGELTPTPTPTPLPSPEPEPAPGRWSRLKQAARSDVKRLLVTGVPHLFVALLGTQGLSMLRRILVARTLGPVLTGQMSYVQTIVDLLAIVADLGVCTSVLKFVAEPVDEKQKARLYANGLFWGMVSSTVVAVLYMAAALTFRLHQEQTVRVFMVMVGPYIILQALAKTPVLFLQARKQIRLAARMTLITQIISLVVVVGATVQWKLWGFFVTVTIAPLSNLVILLIVTRKHLVFGHIAKSVYAKLLPFGFFSMLANATGSANMAAGVVMLTWCLSGDPESTQRAVGLLSNGLTIMTGMFLLPQSLMGVAFPYLSALIHQPDAIRRRVRELAMKQAATMVVMVAVWYFVGQFVIVLVFGRAFHDSYASSVVLASSMIPFALSAPWSNAMMIMNRVKTNLLLSLLQLGTNLTLLAALIPRWGLMGAAVAISAAQLVSSVAAILAGKRMFRTLQAGRQAPADSLVAELPLTEEIQP